jgi:hypothetical protein
LPSLGLPAASHRYRRRDEADTGRRRLDQAKTDRQPSDCKTPSFASELVRQSTGRH